MEDIRTTSQTNASSEGESKSQATRRTILQAAAALFREKGYAAVSLRDIATAVGMKAGSLYYHFANKEALVWEILELGTQGAFDAAKAASLALGKDADPIDRLEAAFRAHTHFLLEAEDFASANLKILQQVPPAIRERHVRQDKKYGEFFADIIRDIDRVHGLDRRIDPSILRMLCFGALNWTLSWWDERGQTPEEIASQLMLMLRKGALAESQVVGRRTRSKKHASPKKRRAP
jgi:AcrR family transcriptional regulator